MTKRRPEPCSVVGCNTPETARSLCSSHYSRHRRTGTVGGPVVRMDLPARFWAKVDKRGPVPQARPDLGPCWLWTACVASRYGMFKVPGKMVPAHRFAYEQAIGPIPDGLVLDHLCCVTVCVNPTHLDPVTQAENIRRARRVVA